MFEEGIGTSIWNFLTNKWVMAHNIFCFLILEWAFRKIDPLYKKRNKELDAKYSAFCRKDNIRRPLFFLFAPGLIIRLIAAYGGIAVVSVIIFFISLTHKRGTPYKGWKLDLIAFMCSVSARITLYSVGV